MPTLTFQGIRANYIHSPATGGDIGAVTALAELRIVYDGRSNFLRYDIGNTIPGDDLPTIEVTNPAPFYAAIDGYTLVEDFIYNSGKSDGFPAVQSEDDVETFLVDLNWTYNGVTGNSTVLVFEVETPVNTGALDYVFVLDGDQLPTSLTTNGSEWFNFVDTDDHIISATVPTGEFGPNQNIRWVEFDQGSIKKIQRMEGNNADNEFHGTNLRDNMVGYGGDDYFVSSKGNDRYIGGNGSYDQVTFRNDPSGVVVNLGRATQQATDGWGNKDTLVSIEMLRGSLFDDRLIGTGGTQIFRGLAGDDTINGRGGRDEVRYDRDVRDGGDNGVKVNLAQKTATDGFGDKDVLISIESVRGSQFGDSITGNAGTNRLRGEAGNDTLNGADGNDQLEGGDNNDRLIGGRGGDFLDGGTGRDVLSGGGGNDEIEGGGGNDQLSGGAGRDNLHGDVGRDRLNGGTGNDVLTGGSGADRFVFAGKVGNDVITDFDNISPQEKIDLSRIAAITGYNDLANNHIGVKNGNIVIQIDSNNSIELQGITINSALEANNFIF